MVRHINNKISGKKSRLLKNIRELKIIANTTREQRVNYIKRRTKLELRSLVECLIDLVKNSLYNHQFMNYISDQYQDTYSNHHLRNLKTLAEKTDHLNIANK